MKKIKLLTPLLSVTTLCATSACMVACAFKPEGPAVENFETDSWDTITYYADKGLDALCKAYNCKPADFIGKKRKIQFNEYEHEVIVLGTNQDQYMKGDNVCDAALTFQFCTTIQKQAAIGDFKAWSLKAKWYATDDPEDNNKNYWDGALELALNSLENNVTWTGNSYEHRSVYTMIKDANSDSQWTDSIKTVARSVCVYKNEAWVPEEKDVKIFIPTVSNIFSKNGIENGYELYKNYANLILAEGQTNITNKQYAYFGLNENIGEGNADFVQHDCLKRPVWHESEKASNYAYALATPMFNDTSFKSIFGVAADAGSIFTAQTSNDKFCVAPCFCL